VAMAATFGLDDHFDDAHGQAVAAQGCEDAALLSAEIHRKCAGMMGVCGLYVTERP
jgi:hypothetical protein